MKDIKLHRKISQNNKYSTNKVSKIKSITSANLKGSDELVSLSTWLSENLFTDTSIGTFRMNIPIPLEMDGWDQPYIFGKNPFTGEIFSNDVNVREEANVQPVNTYYVDKAATGTNDGSSWANAFTTLNSAINQVETDGVAGRIYIAKGFYNETDLHPGSPNADLEIIGDLQKGSGDKVYLSENTNVGLTWTPTSNYYSTSLVNTPSVIRDRSLLDSFGDASNLVAATSIGQVDSTPGSFFWDANTLYIRTVDDREPDSDIITNSFNSYINFSTSSSTLYIKNITFFNVNCLFRNSASSAPQYIYAENCEWDGASVTAHGSEGIFKNCSFHTTSGDILNYDSRNTIPAKYIEYNCTFYNNDADGLGGGTDQFSTTHNGCYIIRYKGNYGATTPQVNNCSGQCIADVTGSHSLNIGNTVAGTPSYGYFNGTGSGSMYIYEGSIEAGTGDVQVDSTANLYYYKQDNIDIDNTSTGTIKEIKELNLVI